MADKKTDEIQHFDSTIAKVDKDGNRVLSNTLEPGEMLVADYEAKEAAKRERAAKKGNDGKVSEPETKSAATDDSASSAPASTDPAASPKK